MELRGLTLRSLAIVVPLISLLMSLRRKGVSLTIIISGIREGEVLATDEDLATYVRAVLA